MRTVETAAVVLLDLVIASDESWLLMVAHGFRCDPKPSGVGGFVCHVCGVKKKVGDMVVAFKNNNKTGRAA